ncbi:MAG: polyphenol oxidase family protein [Actinobacteria bacterium]|nr:polyphenol oxidase family protein [Actinomycetota bacterium]
MRHSEYEENQEAGPAPAFSFPSGVLLVFLAPIARLFNRQSEKAQPAEPTEPTEPNEPLEPAFELEDWGDINIWRFLKAPGAGVCFTTRGGGGSRYPYASLNLGFHVGDDREHVSGNRALLASILGIEPSRITSPYQRHTSTVQSVTDEEAAGSGAFSEESRFDPCDGLITGLPGVPLLLMFADCVPVVLVGQAGAQAPGDENSGAGKPAETKPVVAVLHAGRKGLIEGVLQNGVEKMESDYGVSASDITAAIGPAIGPCCYEVEEEIGREFEEKFGSEVIKNRTEDRVLLDLQEAAQSALTGAGVPGENICILDICTSCHREFFSYRREGVTGRQGAIAWIGESTKPRS